jgi:hypothetical protein
MKLHQLNDISFSKVNSLNENKGETWRHISTRSVPLHYVVDEFVHVFMVWWFLVKYWGMGGFSCTILFMRILLK